MTKCEWCGKEFESTDGDIMCSQECGSAWKRNEIMEELRYEDEQHEAEGEEE